MARFQDRLAWNESAELRLRETASTGHEHELQNGSSTGGNQAREGRQLVPGGGLRGELSLKARMPSAAVGCQQSLSR